MMKKQLWAGLFSLVMLLFLLPLSVQAAATEEVNNIDTLKQAFAAAADGDVIKLTDDIGDADNRLSGVTVDKNITLDLNGHILYVTGNQTNSSVSCAITQTAGTLTITSSTDTKGTVNCDKGGFIKQNNKNLKFTVSNVTISCETTTSAMLYLYAMSEVTLTNCTFTGGKGVPYTYSSNNGSVSYAGNVPIGNKEPFKDDKTKLTVSNCDFTNNHTGIALGLGSDYEISITDSNFTGCDFGVTQNESNTSLSSDLKMDISGTTFSENSHGLCLTSTSYNKNGRAGSRHVTITNYEFENNKISTPVKINWNNVGGNSGAGIYYSFVVGSSPYFDENYADVLKISNCTFNENYSAMQGGAIYISSGRTSTEATISNSTFTNNEAYTDGDALYCNGNYKELTIEGSTVQGSRSSNTAISTGGGEINLRNSNIQNNQGDGLEVMITNGLPANVTLEGVKIDNNSGCGLIGSLTTLDIKDSADKSSSISNNGGGGLNFTEGAVTIQGNTKIENNTSAYDGAGILMETNWADNSSLSVQDNVIIQDNHSTGDGGGIAIYKGKLVVGANVILCNNTADHGGADVYTYNLTTLALPDPNNMKQIYKADNNGQYVTDWYNDFNPRYADADQKEPIDYTSTDEYFLVAAYTPITKYDVTFDLNYDGAADAPEAQEIKDSEKAAAPDPAPTRDGYVFAGWYTGTEEDDGSVTLKAEYDFETPVTADTTLYAKWLQNFTITFKAGDHGKLEGTTSFTVVDGGAFPTLPKPVPDEHYAFTYWTDKDGQKVETFPLTVKEGADYTANWKQISTVPGVVDPKAAAYRVEHYQEQLDGSYQLQETDFPLSGEIGATVTAEAKAYEHFVLNPDAPGALMSGKVVLPTAVADGEPQILTLKVYYDRSIATVAYDLSGGNTGNKDYSADEVKYGATVTVKEAPTKEGYTFTGWSDGTNTYQPGEGLTINDNITLTALWKEMDAVCTLHYESNGGTEYEDESYKGNDVVKLNKVPVREGYQFTGWYADKELTEPITEIKMTSDKTVYAGWNKSTVPDMLNGSDHFAYIVGYSDGTVMPLNNITRAEVATIFFRLLKPDEVRDGNLTDTCTFTDVTEDMWFNKAVSTMAKLGIVKGRTEEIFDPAAPITRAEFAAICARFDVNMTKGNSEFTDLSGHWAKAEVERAVALGWIMGYDDGSFRPDSNITRAEAMTMINRVLCRIPENENDLLPTMKVWPDNPPEAWYYIPVQEATNSHDFQSKGEIYEHWTGLKDDPDWTKYQD